MTIFGIAMIKDEEDIVESFVRYNMTIIDQLIIVDNGSLDGTVDILKRLAKEGYNLVLENYDDDYNQIKVMNSLLKKVASGFYGIVPNYIIPLDADEFIVSEIKDLSPRDIIENLSKKELHKIKWKNYIPDFTELNTQFVPCLFSHARALEYEVGEKLIIPVDIVKDSFVLNNGNHDAFASYKIKKVLETNLRLAHYPVRSLEQFFMKNVLGYINRLCTSSYVKGRSKHIESAYYMIKGGTTIGLEELRHFALQYCTTGVPDDSVEEQAFSLAFCGNIMLKYSEVKKNNIEKIFLLRFEELANKYRKIVCTNNEKENLDKYDIEALNAIEQYSFKKMRQERRLRDYYYSKVSLFDSWIRLMSVDFDLMNKFWSYCKGDVLFYGIDSLSIMLFQNHPEDVNCLGWLKDNLEKDDTDKLPVFNSIKDLVSNNEINAVILFDDSRYEEVSAMLMCTLSNIKIISAKAILDNIWEMNV